MTHHEMLPEALCDIKGFLVVVEELQPELEREGLSREQIQTDVETQFHTAGIKLLSREEVLRVAGNPWLYVKIIVFEPQTRGDYAFSVETSFKQNVVLMRIPPINLSGATTWRTGATGMSSDLDDIRSTVKDQIGIFINAYLSVNPK